MATSSTSQSSIANTGGSFLKVTSVSYEGSIFGWDVVPSAADLDLETNMTFGFHCSKGSLKVIAVSGSGKYMCCGGMDERIHIFNMEEKKAIGEIAGHSGAITSLTFIGDTHLLSGSEDSTICIWRVYDWQCLHILGGHKGEISGISVHPSGKLALSVSKDNTLKTWNLIHGRCAFTRRLRGAANKVLWHSAGEHYLLVVGAELQVYETKDSKACSVSFTLGSRINQAVFTNIDSSAESSSSKICIAVICEDKLLHLMDLTGKMLTGQGVDLTNILDSGRARDMWSSRPASVGSSEMKDIMKDEGASLAIVTSNGLLSILSCRALCQLASEGDACVDYSSAVQSSMQITAQPRLTAVVSWNPSVASKLSSSEKIVSEEVAPASAVESTVSATSSSGKSQKKKKRVSFGDDAKGVLETISPAVEKSKKKNKKQKTSSM